MFMGLPPQEEMQPMLACGQALKHAYVSWDIGVVAPKDLGSCSDGLSFLGFQTVAAMTPKKMARAMMVKAQKIFFRGLRRSSKIVLPPAAGLSL